MELAVPAEWRGLVSILVAFVLAGIIGWEREYEHPAGLRTHILVSMGSAMFTVISREMAVGLANADPTRIAAQIVTGIGFLGGGAILRESGAIRGITTAASIWSVAAIGVACGAELYPLAGGATALTLIALVLLERLKRRFGLDKEPMSPQEREAR